LGGQDTQSVLEPAHKKQKDKFNLELHKHRYTKNFLLVQQTATAPQKGLE